MRLNRQDTDYFRHFVNNIIISMRRDRTHVIFYLLIERMICLFCQIKVLKGCIAYHNVPRNMLQLCLWQRYNLLQWHINTVNRKLSLIQNTLITWIYLKYKKYFLDLNLDLWGFIKVNKVDVTTNLNNLIMTW